MRRRILLLVVGMTTLVVIAFAVPIAVLMRAAVGQVADQGARDQARNAVATLRSGTLTVGQVRGYVSRQVAATGRPMSVLTPGGTLVGSTPVDANAVPPGARLPGGGRSPSSGTGAGIGAGTGAGLGTGAGIGAGTGGPPAGPGVGAVTLVGVPGGRLATTVVPVPTGGAYVVHVYLSDAARRAGLAGWYALIVGGSLGLLLVAGAAGELLTRRIARPLVRTAETAALLSQGDTAARAPVDGPREVADVGLALNRLADRIDELIAEERETVADLSHRLRTPLTTLRLDAEALRDPAESERVSAHVGELERRLTAVIRAARRPQREGRLPSCDASAVVGDRVAFWSALTDEQGRPGHITLPDGPLPVRASAEDLAAAVDALLENVVAHTDEGVAFSVSLSPTADGALLEVADDGPGIPAAAEVRGRSDRGSTGLGLDIARRCAETGGGSMTVDRGASGGAVVRLTLRAP